MAYKCEAGMLFSEERCADGKHLSDTVPRYLR